MNKNRKIRSSILELQAEPVICINNIKGYYIQAVSMSLASFLTKTNVSVIHKFIKKGRSQCIRHEKYIKNIFLF
jgi:magnesium-transporting ATPase (P-type)